MFVAITIVLALLPARWLDRLRISDVAELVAVVVQPFSHPVGVVQGWLRPPRDPLAGESDEARRLKEEIATYRQALAAERMRTTELRDQIEELEGAKRFQRGVEIRVVHAAVTGTSQSRRGGMIRLNRGVRSGIGPGTIAIRGGDNLIGRIFAEELGRLSSWLLPITDPAIGRLDAAVFPADRPDAPIDQTVAVQLLADDTGVLRGDVPTAGGVRPGDVVRLFDRAAWLDTAQGMVLGIVESVEKKDEQPLRSEVVVRPRYDPYRLASVTLKIRVRGDDGGQP